MSIEFRRFRRAVLTQVGVQIPALGSIALLMCGFVSVAAPAAALAQSPQSDPSTSEVVGKVGSDSITESEVIGQDPDDFEKLRAEHEIRLRQLQLRKEQDRYALLKKQTEKLLDEKALALEAKARRKTTEALLATIKVSAVTDSEVRAYYEANKARAKQTFEELKPEITRYLVNQHNTDATRHFYAELRAKHHVTSLLEPYRMTVEATGPARGKEQAPITVVEFADFQCPYCRQAEDTLQLIMAKHPDDLRLVFRELPLASIHPNALIAARAAVCADRQGQFWPMHDAMYGDQNALGESALKDTARRIGLDTEMFSACLHDEATTKSIFADIRAADELNITGTPFFLINGRPVNGNVPADQFESIVVEELRRPNSNNRG